MQCSLPFSPLACVDECVLLHVGLLVEPLPAVLAGVWPSVGVDEQVRRQSGRPLETFTAYFAVETSFLKREQRHKSAHRQRSRLTTTTTTRRRSRGVRCELQDVV